MYKYLVDNFCLQFYLEKSIPKLYKKCITKIRVSSHNLCIESGRHKNIPRDNRFCKTCTSTIEDEYHFILVCPVYKELRSTFLKKYYWGKPSMFKLIRLLSVNNVKELCNLGKYIFRALSLRTNSNMWTCYPLLLSFSIYFTSNMYNCTLCEDRSVFFFSFLLVSPYELTGYFQQSLIMFI